MSDKQSERIHLEAFLSKLPDLDAICIESGESPDFVVSSTSCRIGIELTRHAPEGASGRPNPKEQDSLRKRTMERAEQLWNASQAVALNLTAGFLDHPPLTKPRVPILAEEIVDYLIPRVAGLEMSGRVRLQGARDSDYLPEVHSLRAERVLDLTYGVWQAGRGGWVSRASERVIRGLVDSKEHRVIEYRERADMIWLLITLQHTDAGDVVEAPDTPVDFRVSTAFDRVFTIDVLSHRVVEIPVEGSA